MKIMVVMGTRPEVIKLAPVIAALREQVDVRVCVSGQHREMLTQALNAFELVPDIQLEAMSPGRSLNVLASRLLFMLDETLEREQPDWVVVQGDTTTAFCAGLAAFHRGIRVAHVEAGLRTGDLSSPFPEEANRRLLSSIATMHFAPTRTAKDALIRENVAADLIHITGNTVVDAITYMSGLHAGGNPPQLPDQLNDWISTKPFVLVTCHRRENFGSVLEQICYMVRRLCLRHPDLRWVFPVHLNPAVREPVYKILEDVSNLFLIEPVDYHTSLFLISHAILAVSDSGGIQEEAPSFGTPVVVMRRHTERMEGVDAGFATLAGQDPVCIEAAVDMWLGDDKARNRLKALPNPYGDGIASLRIAALLQGNKCEPFHE